MTLRRVSAASLIFVFLCAGCASTKMTKSSASGEKFAKPKHIIVHDFAATADDVAGDALLAPHGTSPAAQQSADEIAVGRELGAQVATQLVAEIREMGLFAYRAADKDPVEGDLVLKGYFESIEEGSAAKRVMLGFGKGASELRTVVKGFEMTDHGLVERGSAEFDASGSKGPGMLVPVAVVVATANPVGLVVGGAIKAHDELSGNDKIQGQAQSTAESIAAVLRERFEYQGWI